MLLDVKRTFVSVYRYDPARRVFFERVLPAVAWMLALGALLVPVLLFGSVWGRVTDAELPRLLLLIGTVALLLLSAPLAFYWLIRLNRRELYETRFVTDGAGISRTRGEQTRCWRWDEVTALKTVGVGRVQVAKLESPNGNLWIDASLVEETVPPPRFRWGVLGHTVEYADGRTRALRIEASELYRLAAESVSTRA